jgi:hypothetical protein
MKKLLLIAAAILAVALVKPATACGGWFDLPCNVGAALEKAAQDTGKTLEKAAQDIGKTGESIARLEIRFDLICIRTDRVLFPIARRADAVAAAFHASKRFRIPPYKSAMIE